MKRGRVAETLEGKDSSKDNDTVYKKSRSRIQYSKDDQVVFSNFFNIVSSNISTTAMSPQEFIDSHQMFGKIHLPQAPTVDIFRYPLPLTDTYAEVKGGLQNNSLFLTIMDHFISEEMCEALIASFNTLNTTLEKSNDSFIQDEKGVLVDNPTKPLMTHLDPEIPLHKKFMQLCKPFLRDDINFDEKDKCMWKFKKTSPDNVSPKPDDNLKLAVPFHTDASIYTLLVYLKTLTVDQGGKTVWPNAGVAIQPKAGRAVWTNNMPMTKELSNMGITVAMNLNLQHRDISILQHFAEMPLVDKYAIQVQC